MSSDRLQDYLPDDADYAISEEEHYRLWRAHHAAALLANLSHDVATSAGISHDGPSAVADYIRQELLDVLNGAQLLRDAIDPVDPNGADLI